MAKPWLVSGCAALLTIFAPALMSAQEQKTLHLMVGAAAGSDTDQLARLVAARLPAHLPGVASITVENRAVADGVEAMNSFVATAPKDGAALILPGPASALMQALKKSNVRYDAGGLGYLGTLSRAPSVLATWWVTGFRSVDDGRRREMSLGALNGAGVGALYPAVINAMLRTRFSLAAVYRTEADMDAAMEGGEIGGRFISSASMLANRPGWVAQKRVNLLAQVAPMRHTTLPDTPTLVELAGNERDRALMLFVSRDADHARALAVPEGTPPERLAALRKAFDAMLLDAQFISQAQAARLDLSPASGDLTAQAVADELQTPDAVVARMRALAGQEFQ